MLIFICKIYLAMICQCDIYNSLCIPYCPFTKETYLNLIKEKFDDTIQFKNKVYNSCDLKDWYEKNKNDKSELSKFLDINQYLFKKCKQKSSEKSKKLDNSILNKEVKNEDILTIVENNISQNIKNKIDRLNLNSSKNKFELKKFKNYNSIFLDTKRIKNETPQQNLTSSPKNDNFFLNSYIETNTLGKKISNLPKTDIISNKNEKIVKTIVNFPLNTINYNSKESKSAKSPKLQNINQIFTKEKDYINSYEKNLINKSSPVNFNITNFSTIYKTKSITVYDVFTKYLTVPTKVVIKTVFEEEKPILKDTQTVTSTLCKTESIKITTTQLKTKFFSDITTLLETKSIHDIITVLKTTTITKLDAKTSTLTEHETITKLNSKTSTLTKHETITVFNKITEMIKNVKDKERNKSILKKDSYIKNSVSIFGGYNVEPVTIIYTKTVELPVSNFEEAKKSILNDNFTSENFSNNINSEESQQNNNLNNKSKSINSLENKTFNSINKSENLSKLILDKKNKSTTTKNNTFLNDDIFNKIKKIINSHPTDMAKTQFKNHTKTFFNYFTKTIAKNFTKSTTNTIIKNVKTVQTKTQTYTSSFSKTITINTTKIITKTCTQFHTSNIKKILTKTLNEIKTIKEVPFDKNSKKTKDLKNIKKSITIDKEKNKYVNENIGSNNNNIFKNIKKKLSNVNIFKGIIKPVVTYTLTETVFSTIKKKLKNNNNSRTTEKIDKKKISTTDNSYKTVNYKNTIFVNLKKLNSTTIDLHKDDKNSVGNTLDDCDVNSNIDDLKEKQTSFIINEKNSTKIKIKLKSKNNFEKKRVLVKVKKCPFEKFKTVIKEYSIVEDVN